MIKIRYLYYMNDIDVVDLIRNLCMLPMGKINVMKCNDNLMLIG